MTTDPPVAGPSSAAASALAVQRDRVDTSLLKCAAVLLIANSHLESLWPRSWLAADGLLGNELFFALSGFVLTLSFGSNPRRFFPWLWHRLVRIYPALIIVVAIGEVMWGGNWRTWGWKAYAHAFLWPTDYVYFALIVPFYVPYYFMLKAASARVYLAANILPIAVYIYAYAADIPAFQSDTHLHLGARPALIGVAACFQMMALGGWIAFRRASNSGSRAPASQWLNILAAIAVLGIYVAAKYAMVVKGRWAWTYPVLFALVTIEVALFMRIALSDAAQRLMRTAAASLRLPALLGGLTLEIYLVHQYAASIRCLHMDAPAGLRVPFPLNLAIFWAVTGVGAWLLERLVRPLKKMMLPPRG